MANDCYNVVTGKVEPWPFPALPWHKQKWIIDCIKESVHAYFMFEAPAESWGPKADEYFMKVMEHAG